MAWLWFRCRPRGSRDQVVDERVIVFTIFFCRSATLFWNTVVITTTKFVVFVASTNMEPRNLPCVVWSWIKRFIVTTLRTVYNETSGSRYFWWSPLTMPFTERWWWTIERRKLPWHVFWSCAELVSDIVFRAKIVFFKVKSIQIPRFFCGCA